MHILDLRVVAFKFAQDHLFVLSIAEFGLDLIEVARDLGQFVSICFLNLRLFEKLLCLVPKLFNLALKISQHRLQVCIVQFVYVHHHVGPVLANRTPETDASRAVFTEPLDGREAMLRATIGCGSANLALVRPGNHFQIKIQLN